MSEGFPDADKDIEWLHGTMATATAHLHAVHIDPARLQRAQRRRRLSEGGVAAGVLSVALVATAIATYGGGGAGKAPTLTGPTGATTIPTTQTSMAVPPKTDPIVPAGVSIYDSFNGTEGKPTSGEVLAGAGGWSTYQYCQPRAIKNGVAQPTGLLFDLGQATSVADATVSIGIPGADLEMWVADSSVRAMPAVRAGQPPAGFTKVAAVGHAGTKAVLTPPHPITTRYVLVWFAGTLPAVPNPDKSIRCAHDDKTLYGDSITAVQFARGSGG